MHISSGSGSRIGAPIPSLASLNQSQERNEKEQSELSSIYNTQDIPLKLDLIAKAQKLGRIPQSATTDITLIDRWIRLRLSTIASESERRTNVQQKVKELNKQVPPIESRIQLLQNQKQVEQKSTSTESASLTQELYPLKKTIVVLRDFPVSQLPLVLGIVTCTDPSSRICTAQLSSSLRDTSFAATQGEYEICLQHLIDVLRKELQSTVKAIQAKYCLHPGKVSDVLSCLQPTRESVNEAVATLRKLPIKPNSSEELLIQDTVQELLDLQYPFCIIEELANVKQWWENPRPTSRERIKAMGYLPEKISSAVGGFFIETPREVGIIRELLISLKKGFVEIMETHKTGFLQARKLIELVLQLTQIKNDAKITSLRLLESKLTGLFNQPLMNKNFQEALIIMRCLPEVSSRFGWINIFMSEFCKLEPQKQFSFIESIPFEEQRKEIFLRLVGFRSINFQKNLSLMRTILTSPLEMASWFRNLMLQLLQTCTVKEILQDFFPKLTDPLESSLFIFFFLHFSANFYFMDIKPIYSTLLSLIPNDIIRDQIDFLSPNVRSNMSIEDIRVIGNCVDPLELGTTSPTECYFGMPLAILDDSGEYVYAQAKEPDFRNQQKIMCVSKNGESLLKPLLFCRVLLKEPLLVPSVQMMHAMYDYMSACPSRVNCQIVELGAVTDHWGLEPPPTMRNGVIEYPITKASAVLIKDAVLEKDKVYHNTITKGVRQEGNTTFVQFLDENGECFEGPLGAFRPLRIGQSLVVPKKL